MRTRRGRAPVAWALRARPSESEPGRRWSGQLEAGRLFPSPKEGHGASLSGGIDSILEERLHHLGIGTRDRFSSQIH
ncbi:hypothetical protein NDU88_002544 [Pleurodeles waltl]|uniref:Uncharacterized protein n=1 Tax=Pleurodeles waltl TaxID=8319 RepID=A0AAV7Q6Z5_PLEWA|nr:hypothetical protein NDU88_002544 [Pleurodeles waltl]